MDIDSLKILARAAAKPDKANATLRILPNIYKAFQDLCDRLEVMPSHIVEEFMKECCEKYAQKILTPEEWPLSPARRELLAVLASWDEAEVALQAERLRAERAAAAEQAPARKQRKQSK